MNWEVVEWMPISYSHLNLKPMRLKSSVLTLYKSEKGSLVMTPRTTPATFILH